MKISVSQTIDLDDKTIHRLFLHRLEELTEGWYIEKADGSTTRWVLCRESEPHPHCGSTFREEERSLDDPKMQVIRLACELQAALR